MLELAHKSGAGSLHVVDLPYRLSSWALDNPESVALWEDASGELVAWAVMQSPWWVIDYAYLPSETPTGMHAEILNWVDLRARASDRPAWFVNVREDDVNRIRDLEAAGYVCQKRVPRNPWSKVYLTKVSVELPAGCSPPSGFTIRRMAGEAEVASYVELHRSAFGGANMTHSWRSRILTSPQYRAELDLVAVDSDRRLAAFCIAWFDPCDCNGRPCGQIEPMGVHENYRGQGLGRAVLMEALARLYRLGAQEVTVEADVHEFGPVPFYRSIGFEITRQILVFRKEYVGT